MAKSEPIKTEHLLLEPFSEKHLTEKYISWLNDLDVVKYSEQRHKRHTLQICHKYLESFIGTPHYFWAITVFNSDLGHIGNINAYIDEINKTTDVGILIGEKKAWGKGYATEAWEAICNYLFEKVKIRKVTAGTLSTNKRMLRLMKRVGMVEDGRRIRQCLWEGREIDIIHMAIFKEDFKLH